MYVPFTAVLFYVETSTGIIRTSRNLTGQARDQAYKLVIRARDNGVDAQSVEVEVDIYVNDQTAADNNPRVSFPEENQVFDVKEVL